MKITAKQYAQTLFELTDGKNESEIDALILKFLKKLKNNGDFKLVDQVVKIFIEIYNQNNGIVEAKIISSRKLENVQFDDIKNFISQKYSAKEVDLSSQIDENILGGIIIKVGDEVLDGSVERQLQELEKVMKE